MFRAGLAFLKIVVLIEFVLSFPKVKLIVMVPVGCILGLVYWQFVLFKFSKALKAPVAMVYSFTIHIIVCQSSQSIILFLKLAREFFLPVFYWTSPCFLNPWRASNLYKTFILTSNTITCTQFLALLGQNYSSVAEKNGYRRVVYIIPNILH